MYGEAQTAYEKKLASNSIIYLGVAARLHSDLRTRTNADLGVSKPSFKWRIKYALQVIRWRYI